LQVGGTGYFSGNVGIGTTSPSEKLTVSGNILATGETNSNTIKSTKASIITGTDINDLRGVGSYAGYNLTNSPNGTGWIMVDVTSNGSDILSQTAYDVYASQTKYTRYSSNGGATWSAWRVLIGATSGTTNYVTKFTSGGKIIGNSLIYDNGVNVGIGTTSPSGAKLQVAVGNYSTGCRIDGPAGTTFGFMSFYSNGSYRGNIYPTSTGVIYGSASDYRLKENVIKLQNSTERVKKLKPSNFNFLENPGEIADGFIAHEIQEIVPEAVTGRKDEVGIDGKPIYQGVDYSKIVPLLTAALQEAILKIEQLETRIQTLENK
jgi:hypothetical protein